MAYIEVPLSNDKILDLLKSKFALETGQGRVTQLAVETQPPVQNTTVSHLVSVTLEFGLELGEVHSLIEL